MTARPTDFLSARADSRIAPPSLGGQTGTPFRLTDDSGDGVSPAFYPNGS